MRNATAHARSVTGLRERPEVASGADEAPIRR
jgi:hypothetical protein